MNDSLKQTIVNQKRTKFSTYEQISFWRRRDVIIEEHLFSCFLRMQRQGDQMEFVTFHI